MFLLELVAKVQKLFDITKPRLEKVGALQNFFDLYG